MKHLMIRDLTKTAELGRKAMTGLHGGVGEMPVDSDGGIGAPGLGARYPLPISLNWLFPPEFPILRNYTPPVGHYSPA